MSIISEHLTSQEHSNNHDYKTKHNITHSLGDSYRNSDTKASFYEPLANIFGLEDYFKEDEDDDSYDELYYSDMTAGVRG